MNLNKTKVIFKDLLMLMVVIIKGTPLVVVQECVWIKKTKLLGTTLRGKVVGDSTGLGSVYKALFSFTSIMSKCLKTEILPVIAYRVGTWTLIAILVRLMV